MIRAAYTALRRLIYTSSLTRISVELATAQEQAQDAFVDVVSFSHLDAALGADLQSRYIDLNDRCRALREEKEYVEAKLAALSS